MAALLAAGISLGSTGCKKAVEARTSTPRAAARAFAEAMSVGDAAALEQVSTGDDGSLRALSASAALNAAYARLEKAAADRYGDPKLVLGIGRASDHPAKLLASLDAAPEAVSGDQATVGAGRQKVYLKKVGQTWRVDRSMFVPPGDASAHVPMIRAMAAAYDEVTAGLTAGAYETADAAKAAFLGKTMQAVMSQQPAAPEPSMTTRTTVPPASPETRPTSGPS